ncbi:MAG: DUF1844 domain-containing protein [candidate division KSB1 bacterium]|nr:DUF1844 domain-containing protein [candidate division KSB1 bacterium]
MAEQLSLDQKREALFMQLVLSFQAAAWQQMGKIKNPLTDKIERDLQQAQMSIDMIDMLKAKTKGNLNENESRFMDHVLRELQLNYVEEVEKDKKAAQEKLK